MKRFLYGLAVLPFLAGVSLAAQPVALSDSQMDRVTAGFDFAEAHITNVGTVSVGVDEPAPVASATTGVYLDLLSVYHGTTTVEQQTVAGFGP